MKIKEISIFNYKSIKELKSFQLGNINVLIGSNGVGKSNFISFLSLLRAIANKNLQDFVAEKAGANNLLHFGRKQSTSLGGDIVFEGDYSHNFELKPDIEDTFYFLKEKARYQNINHTMAASGYRESILDKFEDDNKSRSENYGSIIQVLIGLIAYHFHDTGIHSPMKQSCDINDNRYLRPNGSNIAAFLFYLKESKPFALKKIESVIREIAPFFDSFILEPLRITPNKIMLEWKEKGNDDYFNADQLSDGSLRMIALTTLLLQPDPPKTIIIDEPELGLHPAAINKLAGLIRKVSHKSQIIVSTQSVTLVNQFIPEDLIIVERQQGKTIFKRLTEDQIDTWLENYSLGEAWEKNIFGGRP